MEISNGDLSLAETLPEVQFLQFQQVNALCKLLSEMESKVCQTHTPGSNSALETEQCLEN